jgi:3-dehydroquinate synthase
VGDVAGFFAATFLRGITLVQVPTTLLALVDSSVGGKVGVDLPEGKNLVGAFHQARLVLGEVAVLTTLPVREVRNGLAEVIKYGIIMDNELFTLLETAADRLVPPDLPLYEQVVSRCCTLKARVVEQDEKETGLRAILNYGHTFAHALETVGEFRALRHGEAVSVGMGMAADLAARTGACAPEVGRRLDALLERCGLPRRLERLPGITPQAVLDCMYRDKKVRAGRLRLVLPREIGAVELVEWRDRDVLLRAIGGRIG